MKNIFNREWLENYKTIPKRDNTIYKNYQNPGMTNWDRQFGSLSPAQKGRYQEFMNTIPDELKGLSAAEMQKYLQGVDEKQAALAQERAGYDAQIQNIRNQEAQRQAQLKAQQEKEKYRKDNYFNNEEDENFHNRLRFSSYHGTNYYNKYDKRKQNYLRNTILPQWHSRGVTALNPGAIFVRHTYNPVSWEEFKNKPDLFSVNENRVNPRNL